MHLAPTQIHDRIRLRFACLGGVLFGLSLLTTPAAAQGWGPTRPTPQAATAPDRSSPASHGGVGAFWDEVEGRSTTPTRPQTAQAPAAKQPTANQTLARELPRSDSARQRRGEHQATSAALAEVAAEPPAEVTESLMRDATPLANDAAARRRGGERRGPPDRRPAAARIPASQPRVGRILPAGFASGLQAMQVQYLDGGVTSEDWWAYGGLPRGDAFSGTKNWVDGGGLIYWLDGLDSPALITTGSAGVGRDQAGVLGAPGTVVLAGNESWNTGSRGGGYLTFGHWFDCNQQIGVSATFLGLSQDTQTRSFASSDFAVLARPFDNLEADFLGPDAELVAFPGLFTGEASVVAESELHGVEVLFHRAVMNQPCCRIVWLAGWRFNRLDEQLTISDSKRALAGSGLPVGTTLQESDQFSTRNDFNGVDLGVLAECRSGRWTTSASMKLALGQTNTTVSIDGNTVATVPLGNGATDVAETPAGLLAQATNIGVYEYRQFAVVPELSLRAALDITCCLRASVGYSFMYWSRVARPGDQIDTDLNLSQLAPGGLVGFPRPPMNVATPTSGLKACSWDWSIASKAGLRVLIVRWSTRP